MCALFSSFFSQKKDIWPGMTDVHSHLLPGVDDGFSSLEDSREMLAFLQELGVKRMFLTPHIMADLAKNRAVTLKEHFGTFRESCEGISVDMHLAAEYMLDECFYERMEEGLLSYDGEHVLVEEIGRASCRERV